MKLDQETVVKHQFWFLLGGYFLIWLFAVMWMKFTYPSAIEDLKKSYDGAASAVKSAQSSGPINTTAFLPPWDKETKEFNAHKGVIWGAAWRLQSDMYDWPTEWSKKYDMSNPQVQLSPDDRNEFKNALYLNEIEYWRVNAPKFLNPVEFKDGFDNVFKPMTKRDWKETPTREEIWLAQEDYWVKRELLFDVYNAMAWQALMVPMTIDEKAEPMPKGVEARYRYSNKNWEITLNIRKNDKGFVLGGDSTIKNIQASRHPQPLTSAKGKGIWFNIGQENVRTTFEVRGEPVSWNEKKNFSEEDYPDPLSGIRWDKDWIKDHPIVVSQGFDQSNCPIRRLNTIELAKQDCRTFIWPLQPNHTLAQLDALPEDQDPTKKKDTTPAPGGAGGMGGGAGGPGGDRPGGAAMMAAAGMRPQGMGGSTTAAAGNRTPNNEIERDRYLQPTSLDKKANPPSRHLPLAIQLIVEQSHMHDVMLALANSRLRFQITQVEFNHTKNYTPQTEDDKDKKDGSGGQAPKVFTGNMPAMAGGSQQMQMQMAARMRGNMQGPQGGDPMQRGRSGMGMAGGGGGAMMRGGSGMGGGAGGAMMRAPGAMRSGTLPAGITDPNQAASNQNDDNLVELTIYGIATLYRSPDAAPSAEQSAQPGKAPTTQAGQQPATPAAPSSGTASPQAAPTQGAAAPANGAAPPPAPTPPAGGATSPPKQPEKPVDQPKTPPPPPPPAGNKR